MKTVEITLDKPRNLKITNNALEYIHEKTGKNLYEGQNILGEELEPEIVDGVPTPRVRVTPKEITTVLFALLRHEDKALTQEQVGDMVGPENFGEVFLRITELVNKVLPQAAQGDATERPQSEGLSSAGGA